MKRGKIAISWSDPHLLILDLLLLHLYQLYNIFTFTWCIFFCILHKWEDIFIYFHVVHSNLFCCQFDSCTDFHYMYMLSLFFLWYRSVMCYLYIIQTICWIFICLLKGCSTSILYNIHVQYSSTVKYDVNHYALVAYNNIICVMWYIYIEFYN